MRPRVSLLLATATVALVVVAAAWGAPRTFAPRKSCGTISGPQWTFVKGPESGTKYAVVAIGSFPCTSAKKWVAKLAADPVKNKTSSLVNNNVLMNGPKGYSSAAHSSKEGAPSPGSAAKG
ncbi:MAG TPA: hypothetical protein VEH79_06210 [Gaiellaceae bacterium]|nr:hypothetical protein [Gaiellaceae bacterium]